MNIEEERKAFQAALPENADWIFVNDKFTCSVVQKRFEAWLAAKVHAAEMVKPTVKVKPKCLNTEFSQYQWVVSLFEGETFNGVLEDFTNKKDAEAWARNCGYRVIE